MIFGLLLGIDKFFGCNREFLCVKMKCWKWRIDVLFVEFRRDNFIV